MSNMAVDVIQSLTFELNKSISFHNAHTNLAIAMDQKRTRIFANGNSVEDSFGLPLQCPKKQSVPLFILPRQHFVIAQILQIASTLVDVKRNIFFVKASTNAGPELPCVPLHILGRCPLLLLEFYSAIGSKCGLGTFGIRQDFAGPAIASNSDSMDPSGCSIMATSSSSFISTRCWLQIT